MISVRSLERGVGLEDEKKVDGVTGRKGRRRKGEERGSGQEGGREGHRTTDWKGRASVFFPATRWVLGGPKASLESGEQIMGGRIPDGETDLLTSAAQRLGRLTQEQKGKP